MSLQMARPSYRKGSRNAQLRLGTPKDLLRAKEQLAAYGIKVPSEVTFSLRTTDKAEIKKLAGERTAHQQGIWQAWRELLRDGPRVLTRKEVFAVISELSRDLRKRVDAEPGDPESWSIRASVQQVFLDLPDRFPMLEEVRSGYRENLRRHLAGRYGWHAVAPQSLDALVDQMIADMPQTFKSVSAMAKGDYREPDWLQGRPKGGEALVTITETNSVPFTTIIDHWVSQRGPAPASVRSYRARIQALTDFVKYTDARQLTEEDVRRWRDAMISEGKKDAETICDHLAAVHSMLRHAVENRLLPVNVAATVKLRKRLDAGTKKARRGFTEEEAKTILIAARNKVGFLRWAPWIMAHTAMRVGEVAQLRRKDVLQDGEGNFSLHVDPEAGRVKMNRERTVPVHPALLEEGFAEFVEAVTTERLFPELYGTKGRRENPETLKTHASVKMSEWIRGPEVGLMDTKIGPSHSWRHLFNTRSRESDMERDARKAIAGHLDDATSAQYGETTDKAMRKQLEKLPPILPPNRKATPGRKPKRA